MSTARLTPGAARAIVEAAQRFGVPPEELLDALAHYATSLWRRPGSWEANTVFNLENYRGEEGFADRWFDDARDYWR